MAELRKIDTDKEKLVSDAKATIERVLQHEPEEVICVFIKDGRVYYRASKTNDFLVQLGALEYAKNKLIGGSCE